MIVYLQVALIWVGVTTVVYWLVAVYSRSVRREKLEKEFDATDPQGGDVAGDRDAYVQDGMAEYAHGLRRRLIGIIWVLPVVAFVVVVYVVNYR
jgi:hypothetical protein